MRQDQQKKSQPVANTVQPRDVRRKPSRHVYRGSLRPGYSRWHTSGFVAFQSSDMPLVQEIAEGVETARPLFIGTGRLVAE